MRKFQLIAMVVFALVCAPRSFSQEAVSFKAQAALLRNTFEPVLFTFSPAIQKHYAVRMYRVTGDERYVYPVIFNLFSFLNKLRYDAVGLNDPAYIGQRARQVTDFEFNLGATNPEARRAALLKGGDVAFYLMLAKNLGSLREYNLIGANVFPESTRLLATLRQQKDKLAALLSKAEYIDKVYALTHVVLAASDCFQYTVERGEFAWILDYFERNMETIIARTKPDVYAEVGLSLLLAGYDQANPALRRVQAQIASDIDPDEGMILSVNGSDDLRSGEHRNVLAIMLLDWPETLTPDPDLRAMAKFQKLLPSAARLMV